MEIKLSRPFAIDGNKRPDGATIYALNENITRKSEGI